MDSQAHLLASPDLLINHPELMWETSAAQAAVPCLGVAQKLFTNDRKLTDFRYVCLSTCVKFPHSVSIATTCRLLCKSCTRKQVLPQETMTGSLIA